MTEQHLDHDKGNVAKLVREYGDNALLHTLFGPHNANLDRLEHLLGVMVSSRGNRVTISGAAAGVEAAGGVLDDLYQRLQRGMPVVSADFESAVKMGGVYQGDGEEIAIVTRKRRILPRSPAQADYMRAIERNNLVFALGPAGTGKTYLAVAKAVAMMMAGEVDRIVLSRPAVEAGERLGFLPGDVRDKVDPYLRPLYDALHDMMPGDQVAKRLTAGDIEVAPLAFMRGRTLTSSFVILDEAQNTTPVQMKMFLTRLGEHSRMVVNGDPSQVDLPAGTRSGLDDALDTLTGVNGIGFVRFTDRDVTRHDLVTRIVRAYDDRDRAAKGNKT